jgi:hypothetical protein|tara:strand:+ start:4961 stop:5332 length:372 start_codon:yes stop_codon:yes gene_type:complete
MKRHLIGLLIAILVSGCATIFSSGPDVSGTWNITINIQGTQLNRSLELVQDGEQLTGTYATDAGRVPLTGTFSDGSVNFKINLEIQGQRLELTYTATVDEDKISGTMSAGDFGTGSFTGTRQQ